MIMKKSTKYITPFHLKRFCGYLIDRVGLPFRKDKELYMQIYDLLGVLPHDISLYKQALMHRSVAHRNEKGRFVNNERLEFLGDAVLDATVGHIVFEHFPGKREGFLTNTRSKLVQRDTLGKLAEKMGITRLVLSSGRSASHNSYMGGNAFEALVGALYLDHGYDACMYFLQEKILNKMVNIDKVAYKEVNFKSKLIEWTQKNRVQMEFRCNKTAKDSNGSPTFDYTCVLEGIDACSGKGFSKKEAQQHASEETLMKLRKQPKFCESIFRAKTERTKMEEQPVMAAPDIEKEVNENKDFIISADNGDEEVKMTAAEARKDAGSEFDFSDVGEEQKPMTREEIIAAAEAAAFEQK